MESEPTASEVGARKKQPASWMKILQLHPSIPLQLPSCSPGTSFLLSQGQRWKAAARRGDALAKDAVAAAAPTGLLLPPVVVLGAKAA